MALSPRQRQKKTEKRNKKQKERRKLISRHRHDGFSARLERAAYAPILHCCASQDVWEQGIGYVFLSRDLGGGEVAFANFLLDVYCLGVKDAMSHVSSRKRYEEEFYERMTGSASPVKLKPECARKLVEGGVAYAQEFGWNPHPDYRKARVIFGDIDAGACAEEFEYGQEGKPLFVAGPYDDEARCRHILRLLTERYGEDGFHNFLPIGPDNFARFELGADEVWEDEDSDE